MASFNVALSDIMLWVQLAVLYAVTVDSVRARLAPGGTPAVRRFSDMMLGLTAFFTFFTVIYLDRRHDIWPGVDLAASIGFEWPWVPRMLVAVTVGAFWVTYRYKAPRRK